jgi:hypothetical protein
MLSGGYFLIFTLSRFPRRHFDIAFSGPSFLLLRCLCLTSADHAIAVDGQKQKNMRYRCTPLALQSCAASCAASKQDYIAKRAQSFRPSQTVLIRDRDGKLKPTLAGTQFFFPYGAEKHAPVEYSGTASFRN